MPKNLWLFSAILHLLLVPGTRNASGQDLTITPVEERKVLYRWATDRCEDEFIPDSPARAFRRADGQMVLIAAHRENWSLVGSDFASLRPSCRSTLRSSEQRQTGTGNLWIQATYTLDGQRVAALVSEDFSLRTKQAGCDPQGRRGRCWLNNLIAATSTDGGASFSLAPPDTRVVASLADRYPDDAQARYGVFTSSNIVKRGDAYFTMAFVQGAGEQRTGNCLFRTDDPFSPDRWRAWDGTDFTVSLRPAAGSVPCAPLSRSALPTEVRSLTFDTQRNVWIAVYLHRRQMRGDMEPVSGFYYSLSPDLLNWSRQKRIMASPMRPRVDSWSEMTGYPALLDPDSRSRNFDTLDSGSPVLLFMRANLSPRGTGSLNRDLMYVRLRVQ
jgi:hypothetical protein